MLLFPGYRLSVPNFSRGWSSVVLMPGWWAVTGGVSKTTFSECCEPGIGPLPLSIGALVRCLSGWPALPRATLTRRPGVWRPERTLTGSPGSHQATPHGLCQRAIQFTGESGGSKWHLLAWRMCYACMSSCRYAFADELALHITSLRFICVNLLSEHRRDIECYGMQTWQKQEQAEPICTTRPICSV